MRQGLLHEEGQNETCVKRTADKLIKMKMVTLIMMSMKMARITKLCIAISIIWDVLIERRTRAQVNIAESSSSVDNIAKTASSQLYRRRYDVYQYHPVYTSQVLTYDKRSEMATSTTTTTTTTTAATSDLFCRGLRRHLDQFIVNERDLDRGVQLGRVPSNASEEEVTTFIAEIILMSTLEHKHVIWLRGLAVIDEMPNLLLPFIANGDLLGYVRSPQRGDNGIRILGDDG
ncbi:hypothetical protein LSH36_932g01000 [Paralvinella palmiformis]|uniref:Serine-threonine/tyrosine-protein kinase catalytic domain-containing protein n=1 Tax=Paralvinella palmiformis TaxID=53620 RepID=A0AAD9IX78_9ANNE|nr:hypothetical protein LSH36_932g01000 [Paralvinella palmiformis]